MQLGTERGKRQTKGEIRVTSEEMSDLLRTANTVAVVGLTDRPGTASYDVGSYIQSQGYDLIPVNPTIESSLGHKAVPSLDAVSQNVDVVDVFTNRIPLDEIGRMAASKGVKAIWLQPGVTIGEGVNATSGVPVVQGKCIMREHRRLLAGEEI